MELNKYQISSECVIFQAELGEWLNLNHMIVCLKTQKAVIVDPFDGDFWFDVASSENLLLSEVWFTHTHFDHIRGLERLEEINPDIIFRWHAAEKERGWHRENPHVWTHRPHSSFIEKCGQLEILVHVTPGHSPGHVAFEGPSFLISGDCLFLGRCGRVDLFGGNTKDMWASINYLKSVIHKKPPSSLIFPGHRYEIDDGTSPLTLSCSELLEKNPVLLANSYEHFLKLPFLSFDDHLSSV